MTKSYWFIRQNLYHIKYKNINSQTIYASAHLGPPHHELHKAIVRPLKIPADEWEQK